MIRVQSIVLVLVVLAGGFAWGMAITHQAYDFDEVQRAHSIWMTSQGLRPYEDFLECHPPYFALLAPLARGQSDPGAMLASLRWLAAIGNLVFVAGLAAVALTSGGTRRIPAILGTALVAFHPEVIKFLAEFRIDGWGYALAVWSIVWFLRSRAPLRHLGFGIGTGIATLLFCPKLALLPPLIVLMDQVVARRAPERALGALATYAAGLSAAGGLFWIWLMAEGIAIDSVAAYLVRYHALSNSHSGFGYGLLGALIGRPTLTVPIVVGVAAWLAHSIRAKSWPNAYLAALALWLVAQAGLVSYPWKQYYAPWLLFACAFFPCLYDAANRVSRHAAAALIFGACALSIAACVVTGHAQAGSRDVADLARFLRILDAVSNAEDRIVATPPFHPIFRRDTFYVWFNTVDPAGYETEQIMDAMPRQRDRVSEQAYRQELERHPPAFVVFAADIYPRRQAATTIAFLDEHRYESSSIGNVTVAVRPDRLEQFLRNRTLP